MQLSELPEHNSEKNTVHILIFCAKLLINYIFRDKIYYECKKFYID